MAENTSKRALRRARAGIPALALGSVIALGLVATIAGFVLRPGIERAAVLWYLRSASGLAIDATHVERSGDGFVLSDVSASTAGGAVSLFASRADVSLHDRDARIVLEAPHVALALDRYRGDEAARFHDAMSGRGLGDTRIAVSVRDGTAAIISGEVPEPALSLASVSGWSVVSPANIRYDATAALEDSGRRYPIAARSEATASGILSHTLTASALPLAPFAALLPSDGPVGILGGELDNVAIDDGAELTASMQLANVAATFDAHTVSNLSGPLRFAGNGAGSEGLTGIIDGIPLTAAGEIHDLGPHFTFLRDGSNDLANLAQLAGVMAREPQVNAIQVEAEAPGLAFGQYAMTTEHGPLAVSILAADPREPTLRFDTALAEDRIISGGERTSAMGLRTGAVGGINGDYFDIGRTYQPQGMLVRAGELIRGPVDRAVLAIDKQMHVSFGEFHLVGSVRAGNATYPVTQLNDWPAGNATVITPAFGKELPASPGTTFARLEPLGTGGNRYRVTAVESADTSLPVSFGVAFGPKLGAVLHVGETLQLSYRTEPSVDGAVAAIGGGPILVRDGDPYEDPHAPAPDERNYRWPVIALAQTDAAHLLLVAVDGRHPERSIGMMRPEFADLLIRLGARNAMALDSGGSVTLVSRKVGDANVSVRNVPSDNSAERWVSDALFIYSSAPLPTIVPTQRAPTPVPEVRPSP